MSWLKKLFGAEQSAPAPAVPEARPAPPLAGAERVLVVEPSRTIQKVVELTLADQGCRITAVTTAEEAMASLSATPPTVVIAWAGLAESGCAKILEAVKSRPELDRTIVLVLRGAFEPADDTLLGTIEPEAAITKPFDPATLIDRIRTLRQRRPMRAS